MTIDTAGRAALAPINQARVALSRRLLEHIDDQSEVIHTNITPDLGATFWMPLDQIIELIPVIKASAIVHTTREMTPTFRD